MGYDQAVACHCLLALRLATAASGVRVWAECCKDAEILWQDELAKEPHPGTYPEVRGPTAATRTTKPYTPHDFMTSSNTYPI